VICVVAGGVSGAKEEAAAAAFAERYRQRYKIPLQTYAPYAYDATMVFASAMQQANSTDPVKFLPALAKIKYHGVTGDIAFDPNGDLSNAALTLYTYRKGQQVKLQVVR
jgi:branched-chain amino acid transport system substrate-binding protein